MKKIWITADLHFGHSKPFLYEPRGFSSIEEHDKTIIKNWNSIVNSEDEVFILGDLMLNDNEHGIECLRQLNGHLNILRGNHETDNRWELYATLSNVNLLGWAQMLKYHKYYFYLSHYPTIINNYDADQPLKTRIINLCGHSHNKDPFCDKDKGLIYHCELDAHSNYPILLDNIIKEIKEKINK